MTTNKSYPSRGTGPKGGYRTLQGRCVRDKYLDHRDLEMKAICEKDPHITLDTLGGILGITRERVRQLINQYNRRNPDDPIIRSRRPRERFYCQNENCSTEIARLNKSGKCHKCKKEANVYKGNCHYCGKLVVRTGIAASARRAMIKRGITQDKKNNLFCSVTCVGKWRGGINKRLYERGFYRRTEEGIGGFAGFPRLRRKD